MDWLQWITALGVPSAIAIALAAYFKSRPDMKVAEIQGEAALWAEIKALRSELKIERETCDERIARLEKRHETDRLEMKAEVRVLRHDRNNVRQALNAMFTMLKREGADVGQVVAAIEDMLKRGDEVIAVEKGAMRG